MHRNLQNCLETEFDDTFYPSYLIELFIPNPMARMQKFTHRCLYENEKHVAACPSPHNNPSANPTARREHASKCCELARTSSGSQSSPTLRATPAKMRTFTTSNQTAPWRSTYWCECPCWSVTVSQRSLSNRS